VPRILPDQAQRRLVSVAQAAAYADVNIRTVYRWIADGRLRGYRVGPKLIKVDLFDLDRLIQLVPTTGNGAA
jgi:excisionase family DNA binding protein